MKHLLTLVGIILFVVIFTACKKDETKPLPPASSILNSGMLPGKWKVGSYSDNGTDKTNLFNGYVIQFYDKTIVAIKANDTISGAWSSKTEDNQLKVNMDFGLSAPFNGFNQEWNVIQINSSVLKLTHVSEDTNDSDFLNFEKL